MPTVDDADAVKPPALVPEHLVPNEPWAVARVIEAEPFFVTLLRPRRARGKMWVVDAVHSDGRRAVAILGGDYPKVPEFEGEIAAPLSMSGRRVPDHFEVMQRTLRDARPPLPDGALRAQLETAIEEHPTLASVRVMPWPVLSIHPRFPFAEAYFAFVGPGGHRCIARATPRLVGESTFLSDLLGETVDDLLG